MSTTTMYNPNAVVGGVVQTPFGNYTVASDKTVTVDSRAVSTLLGAGYVPVDAELPVGTSLMSGSHTVTSGEATAHSAALVTGLSAITSRNVQITRSNVDKPQATITVSGGTITVADNGSTYVLTAGDVIYWMATGTL